MYVGVLSVRLHLHGVLDLKAKRRIVLQIKDRVRAKFNCAVAEVGDLDLWQVATIGVSVVSNEGAHANSALDQIARFIDGTGLAEMLDHTIEVLSVKDGAA
jgi:uncharacterized protein YlxP (DUF503 family)